MSDWNEELPKFKAARAGIVEQRPLSSSKTRKPRPVVVEYRRARPYPPNLVALFSHDGRAWRKWGAYHSVAEAEQMVAGANRKYSFNEYRVSPE